MPRWFGFLQLFQGFWLADDFHMVDGNQAVFAGALDK
jgi:hypothetical protein